jgi:hypothetical protein
MRNIKSEILSLIHQVGFEAEIYLIACLLESIDFNEGAMSTNANKDKFSHSIKA